MESNGKQIDREGRFVDFATGPIIWGEPGTNAQHSFYQLIHQGVEPICLEMIGFKESQTGADFTYEGTTSQEKLLANLFAQAIALAKGQSSTNPNQTFLGNRPSHILLGKHLTPYTLGVLLAHFEHKTAFQGFLWNINSFDQEGVQLGKVLANKIIDRFKAFRGEKMAEYPLADAYLQHLYDRFSS
jgi:glucose-6-phosphate isomerase